MTHSSWNTFFTHFSRSSFPNELEVLKFSRSFHESRYRWYILWALRSLQSSVQWNFVVVVALHWRTLPPSDVRENIAKMSADPMRSHALLLCRPLKTSTGRSCRWSWLTAVLYTDLIEFICLSHCISQKVIYFICCGFRDKTARNHKHSITNATFTECWLVVSMGTLANQMRSRISDSLEIFNFCGIKSFATYRTIWKL